MKVLITGAGGLLGAYLVQHFNRLEHEVVALGRRNVPYSETIISHAVDLVSEADRAKEIIVASKPDWVIHCAAMTDLLQCEIRRKDAQMNNVYATDRIAMVTSDIGSNLLYISTDNVYPGREGGHYSEMDMGYTLNEYALSKYEGEQYATESYAHARRGQLLIVRESHYGWNAHNGQKMSVVEAVINTLKHGDTWTGWSNVFFSPIYCGTLCAMLEQMMLDNMSGVFNIGCQERVSKYKFAYSVAKVWGLPFNIHPTLYSPKVGEPSRPLDVSLNCERAYSAGYGMPTLVSDLEKMRDDTGEHRRLFE